MGWCAFCVPRYFPTLIQLPDRASHGKESATMDIIVAVLTMVVFGMFCLTIIMLAVFAKEKLGRAALKVLAQGFKALCAYLKMLLRILA